MYKKSVIIVSGLPRSGTSMMMKMLDAGGLEVVTDNLRAADDDNLKGYYELEKVKQLNKNDEKSWLKEYQGKVVKVISQLLTHLPDDYAYKVVFMRRRMEEILASQNQMLIRRGESSDRISDEKLAVLFENHLDKIMKWLKNQSNFDVIYVSYNDVLIDPDKHIKEINQFFDCSLNTDEMKCVIDKLLYRQRT